MTKPVHNLTSHVPTPSQVAAGVVDFPGITPAEREALLNVDTNALMMFGQDYLEDKAVHIINQLIIPIQIQQAEALLVGEWQCGSQNTGGPITGFQALNAVYEALTVHVMAAGQSNLFETLKKHAPRGVIFHTALTERRSVERHNPDGTVTKTNVFEHVGFFPPVK